MHLLFSDREDGKDQRDDCKTFAEKGHCNDEYGLWMTKYCSATCSGEFDH